MRSIVYVVQRVGARCGSRTERALVLTRMRGEVVLRLTLRAASFVDIGSWLQDGAATGVGGEAGAAPIRRRAGRARPATAAQV